MSYSAQQCFERARECELMVSEAKDNRAKELARQKEFLLDRPESPVILLPGKERPAKSGSR
jgi:hypothetical protein